MPVHLALVAALALAAPLPRDGRADAAANVRRMVELLKREPAPAPRGTDNGIYLLDLDGGPAVPAATRADPNWPVASFGSAAWARDGRRIFFDATPGPRQWARTITHTIELTDRGLVRAPFGPGNCPAPAPDGKCVAVLLNGDAIPGTEPGIHFVGPNGGNPRPLGVYGIPEWSPSGKDLVVAQFGDPTALELANGEGENRPVDLPGYTFHSSPSWADEKTLVVSVRSADGVPSVALVDITIPSAAVVRETLWKGGGESPIQGAMYPTYSPVARRGAFVGTDAQGRRLYGIEPGKPPRPLEPNRPASRIGDVVLSPDARYLLFSDFRRD